MIGQGSLPVSRRADVSRRCQRPGGPRRAVRCRSTCSILATATATVRASTEGTHRCVPASRRLRCGHRRLSPRGALVRRGVSSGHLALSAHRRELGRCHHRPPGRHSVRTACRRTVHGTPSIPEGRLY